MYSAITGAVLAGGENSRMNTPKPLLRVGGESIIDRQLAALREVFGDVVVVSGTPGLFTGLGVRVVPDDPGFCGIRGPLIGVYTAVKESRGDCFVVACDMPFIKPGLMAMLAGLRAGHDAVIPFVRGYAEPLFGLYTKGSLAAMEDTLVRGGRRVQDIYGVLDVVYAGEDELRRCDPGLLSFINVNTPADLARAQEVAAGARPAGICGAMPK